MGRAKRSAEEREKREESDLIEGLTENQLRIFRSVQQGKSCFFTGPAGTGKSFILDRVRRWLKRTFPPSAIAIAACAPSPSPP